MKQQMNRKFAWRVVCAFVLTLLVACGGSKINNSSSVEEIYKEAVRLYEANDLLESQLLFDKIKTQYTTSQFADDAQYYLAEIHYKKGEFILAAFNFNLLNRTYINSQYSKISAFKVGMCYFELSPTPARDQEYTKQAIQAFSEFQAFYPSDSLATEAGRKIVALREKLAQKEFDTAELYVNMQNFRSALIYYEVVLSDYADTKFFEPAFFGKIQTQSEMRRSNEARETIRLYKKRFPNGQFITAIEKIEGALK